MVNSFKGNYLHKYSIDINYKSIATYIDYRRVFNLDEGENTKIGINKDMEISKGCVDNIYRYSQQFEALKYPVY